MFAARLLLGEFVTGYEVSGWYGVGAPSSAILMNAERYLLGTSNVIASLQAASASGRGRRRKRLRRQTQTLHSLSRRTVAFDRLAEPS